MRSVRLVARRREIQMISTPDGRCRGNFCSRSSNLKPISTYSRFVLAMISTESAYKIRCDCPAFPVNFARPPAAADNTMTGHNNGDPVAAVGRFDRAHGLGVINGGYNVIQAEALAGACPAVCGSQYSSPKRVRVSKVADTGETPALRRCSSATYLILKMIHIRMARISCLPLLCSHFARHDHDKQQHRSA